MSPPLNALAILLEGLTWKTFGEIVSVLELCGTFLNKQPSIRVSVWMIHMGPEEVPLDTEVLGPGCDSLVVGKKEGSLVILEDITLDNWIAW